MAEAQRETFTDSFLCQATAPRHASQHFRHLPWRPIPEIHSQKLPVGIRLPSRTVWELPTGYC